MSKLTIKAEQVVHALELYFTENSAKALARQKGLFLGLDMGQAVEVAAKSCTALFSKKA